MSNDASMSRHLRALFNETLCVSFAKFSSGYCKVNKKNKINTSSILWSKKLSEKTK